MSAGAVSRRWGRACMTVCFEVTSEHAFWGGLEHVAEKMASGRTLYIRNVRNLERTRLQFANDYGTGAAQARRCVDLRHQFRRPANLRLPPVGAVSNHSPAIASLFHPAEDRHQELSEGRRRSGRQLDHFTRCEEL